MEKLYGFVVERGQKYSEETAFTSLHKAVTRMSPGPPEFQSPLIICYFPPLAIILKNPQQTEKDNSEVLCDRKKLFNCNIRLMQCQWQNRGPKNSECSFALCETLVLSKCMDSIHCVCSSLFFFYFIFSYTTKWDIGLERPSPNKSVYLQ